MSDNGKEIKPIETMYNGYRFRSRTEARWAVFLDSIGLDYEYEKEGYDLGDSGWYLPDFWLPLYQMFIEVKGGEPTPIEIEKARALTKLTGHRTLIAVGPPERDRQWGVLPDDIWGWSFGVCRRCEGSRKSMGLLLWDGRDFPVGEEQMHPNWCTPSCDGRMSLDVDSRHYAAAKSARFERGESGA